MDTPIIPQPSVNNPGKGKELTIAFTNGEEKWQEIIDLNQLLTDILAEGGYTTGLQDGWLILNQGLALLPQFLHFDLNEEGTAQTSSTIEIRAVSGLFSEVFEYQHARSEESVTASFRSGFSRWMQVDLVVLLDALEEEPRNCSMMKMDFNEEQGLKRRILLGPVEHYAVSEPDTEEEHPFCPCCLFSNSMEGFLPLLKSADFYAVRMYAARNGDGELMADCRVNGEDWEAGKNALLQYINEWPQRGLEYRKQMIVIRPDNGATD